MKKLYFLAALLLSLQVMAQEPAGFRESNDSFNSRIERIQVANLTSEELWAMADKSDRNGTLPIYGKIIEQPMNALTDGEWTYFPNGDKMWQLRVYSPGALSMDVFFKQLYLPEGSQLFAYTGDREWFVGPYNSDENSETGLYRTPEVFGDDLVLEYYHPFEVMEQPVLNISGFGHYFRFVHDDRFERASDPCEVDVKCPEGVEWADDMKAVVKLSIPSPDGVGLCSGTLVNNTSYDCRKFILTAMHCTETSTTANFGSVVVRFNYQKSACGSGISASAQQKTGTVRLADSNDGGGASGSDFCLLEMTQAIPATWSVYYAGWNANTTAPTASTSGWKAICIHHPAGDVKKISTAGTVSSGTWQTSGHHWRVNWIQTVTNWGVTEGGSSGSPLFNKDHQIIGTLTGGGSYCDAPTAPDYYGKMDKHFTSNPNPANEDLVDWLDAAGTGLLVCDGSYPGTAAVQPCFGVVGVEESVSFQELTIFPTRVEDSFTLTCPRFDLLKEVRLYTQDGRLVESMNLTAASTIISASNFASGMYFIQVVKKDGSSFNKKFVKL
ncbi:MAG: trypsin-like peptidase domain-containing protein [Flavobacteriales bacterium]|nr:trypsin-like peptidase domain-containing protein [Flavobacteriales bacterium]